MFKFFGFKKETVEQTIVKIHNEFDSASEKLLKEAKEILSVKIDSNKGDRLRQLGFSQAKPVTDNKEIIDAQNKNRAVAKCIEYFQQWYPHHKFITEEIVAKICKKYGLCCGDVNYYKGDVPEKNIREMEAFKLREEDMDKFSAYDEYIDRRMWSGLAQAQRSMMMGRFPTYEPIPLYGDQIMQMQLNVSYRKKPFKICAPEKDFDMAYMTKYGYKLIPDPIVLQPVKGGYLIVTKWGLEASDELVTNPKQN